MPTVNNPVRSAFTRAIHNDAKGVVSEKDAKKILDAAVKHIGRSDKPKETYESNQRYVAAATVLLGQDKDAREVLESYNNVGLNAVTARLTAMTGETQLPHGAKEAFVDLMLSPYWRDEPEVKIANIKGNERDGFELDYEVGAHKGKAFITGYEGSWISSPVKLEKKDLDLAVETMQSYFDEHWAAELLDDYDTPADEIASMRASLLPEHVFFPHMDSDPYNYSEDYELCFGMNNPTGSDHGFYVGLDRATGNADAYDFN